MIPAPVAAELADVSLKKRKKFVNKGINPTVQIMININLRTFRKEDSHEKTKRNARDGKN